MMFWTLLLVGQLAAQEPRFTMTPEPGDTTTAEVFELRNSDAAAEEAAAMLPGDGPVEVRSSEGMNVAYRAGTLPGGPIVIYPSPKPNQAPQYACRVARDSRGANENAERAGRWCLSFVMQMAPVLELQPIPAPPPGSHR